MVVFLDSVNLNCTSISNVKWVWQVGINVPVPVPVPVSSSNESKASFAGDLNFCGIITCNLLLSVSMSVTFGMVG